MVDWKRLGLAVLCTATLAGGCIVLVLLPNKVSLVLAVCMIISAFYKALGDNSDKDKKNGTDKD